ncbi:hypothetical protein HNV11_01575 [Spirosoma taeanense]|uniref:Lipopolysaccharide biosynthesis protein n=1 Tax=Spirosoma taeanense TaxID=2735870 RepID=A0A6M5Y474_9BACT|nr:hypothetical protein [Spirosoma taeanense]QJW88160.1 hypothetical protein HNV11_01575 [Spirosoma taeanense]
MNITTLLRLLKRNLIWLLALPLITAVTVYVLTMNMAGQYESKATLYTGLASSYSIRSDEKGKLDFYAIANALDNIVTTLEAPNTLAQVGRRLLAQHLLLQKPDPMVLSAKGFKELQETVGDSLRRLIVVPGSVDSTTKRIENLIRQPGASGLADLLEASGSKYSADGIGDNLIAKRAGTMTDIISLAYKSDDPAVTQQTLNLLVDVFTNRYMDSKSTETRSVVQFYENKTREAANKLQAAEAKLQSFGSSNEIVNYDEQAKAAASGKSTLEMDYQREQMRNRGARAGVATLEKRLKERSSFLLTSGELRAKRDELSTASERLANAEVTGQPRKVIDVLQARVNSLSEDLKNIAQKYYSEGNSSDALPQESVMSEWLSKVLEYDESTARLEVYQKHLNDYDASIQKLAPLGPQLIHLRREVDVAEKEYMSVLNGLNMAKLQQKNVEMAGPINMIDKPDYPQKSSNVTRWLIVIGSFVGMLFLVILMLSLRTWMNNRIQNPERAEQITGLSLAAAFPLIHGRFVNRLRSMKHSMIEQLRSAVVVELSQQSRPQPHLITILSTRPAQGKTWVGNALSAKFAMAGHRVAYLYPEGSALIPDETATPGLSRVQVIPYAVQDDFVDTQRAESLIEGHSDLIPTDYDYIFLELPSLMETAIPAHLAVQSSVSLVVIDAQSVWTKTDQSLTDLYRRASHNGCVLGVLNRIDMVLVDALPATETSLHRPALPPAPSSTAVVKSA